MEGGELVQKDLEALRMNTSHIIFFAKGHTCQENLIVSTLVSRGRKIFFIIPQVSYGERERGEERERGRKGEKNNPIALRRIPRQTRRTGNHLAWARYMFAVQTVCSHLTSNDITKHLGPSPQPLGLKNPSCSDLSKTPEFEEGTFSKRGTGLWRWKPPAGQG